jgi:hypothetical protein
MLTPILLWHSIVAMQGNARFPSFQTFSLEAETGLLITGALLDRFLACMKPASMTERRP